MMLVGVLTIAVGLTVVIFRRSLAIRASRLLRRRFGALGEENAKVATSNMYGFSGLVFIAIGVWDIVKLFA